MRQPECMVEDGSCAFATRVSKDTTMAVRTWSVLAPAEGRRLQNLGLSEAWKAEVAVGGMAYGV